MNQDSSKSNDVQLYQEHRQEGDMQAKQNQLGYTTADGQESIVAVRKNAEGDIIAIQTSTGRELEYVAALNEAKAGRLAHVDVFHRYGRDILRSEPDGIKQNNLDHLPTF